MAAQEVQSTRECSNNPDPFPYAVRPLLRAVRAKMVPALGTRPVHASCIREHLDGH